MGHMGCLYPGPAHLLLLLLSFLPFSFLFFLILLLYPAVLSIGKASPRLTL